ncbi:MAG: glycosyl hydrolase [Oceanipulchritudo sp.]
MTDETAMCDLPRMNFDAPLEPVDGILHGAGQDREAWEAYCAFMAPEGLRPDMFMAYAGLRGFQCQRLESFRPYWEEGGEDPPLMQLGLSMTSDGQPEKCYAHEVAAGKHDESVRHLGRFFAAEERPLLVRIGYECTGPWNGYEPESYKAAFQRVASILREYPFPLATVWCVEGGWTEIAWDFYPGDEMVDWFSVDLFSPGHFTASEDFMQACLERGKPVLVGECTPRRVGVLDGPQSWEGWYAPFFEWIGRHPHVKGFSYINWEWSRFPQWSDWGDGRLQMNEFVRKNWIQAVGRLKRKVAAR